MPVPVFIVLIAALLFGAPHSLHASSTTTGSAAEQKKVEENQPEKGLPASSTAPPVVTRHTSIIEGKEISYSATAGQLPILNDAGEPVPDGEEGFPGKLASVSMRRPTPGDVSVGAHQHDGAACRVIGVQRIGVADDDDFHLALDCAGAQVCDPGVMTHKSDGVLQEAC